jgi:hypothetical protein
VNWSAKLVPLVPFVLVTVTSTVADPAGDVAATEYWLLQMGGPGRD